VELEFLDPHAGRNDAPNVQLYGWNFNTQSNGLPVYVEELAFVNDDLTSNSYGITFLPGYNVVRDTVLVIEEMMMLQ
jgi:hypothetical protein